MIRVFIEKIRPECLRNIRVFNIEYDSTDPSLEIPRELGYKRWLRPRCAQRMIELCDVSRTGIISVRIENPRLEPDIKRFFRGAPADLLGISIWDVGLIHGSKDELSIAEATYSSTTVRPNLSPASPQRLIVQNQPAFTLTKAPQIAELNA